MLLAEAAVHVVMAAKVPRATDWYVAEAAVAERFFRAGLVKPRPKVGLVAPVGFAAAGMVGIFQTTGTTAVRVAAAVAGGGEDCSFFPCMADGGKGNYGGGGGGGGMRGDGADGGYGGGGGASATEAFIKNSGGNGGFGGGGGAAGQ